MLLLIQADDMTTPWYSYMEGFILDIREGTARDIGEYPEQREKEAD